MKLFRRNPENPDCPWSVRFSVRNKIHAFSTKTTDKAIALRMAQEWEHVERVAVGGQATVAKFQKVVNQVVERVIGDSMPLQTVRQYF